MKTVSSRDFQGSVLGLVLFNIFMFLKFVVQWRQIKDTKIMQGYTATQIEVTVLMQKE